MKKKNCLTLDKEFIDYCKLNNVDDIEKLAKQIFNRGFAIVKYGELPISALNTTVLNEVGVDNTPKNETVPITKNDLYDE